MAKKRRAILVAFLTIALCLLIAAVGTYALFTDSVRLTTHLKAGELDITLIRTNLSTKTLDNDTGFLVANENPEDVDFSTPSTRNVFDITTDTLIVPCCSYDAEMKISNNSDVAFSWWIEVLYDDVDDIALADQLKVTVTYGNTANWSYLSSGLLIGSQTNPIGTLAKTGSASFNVKIEFVDDNAINNAAQDQYVNFDIVVHAVQATHA